MTSNSAAEVQPDASEGSRQGSGAFASPSQAFYRLTQGLVVMLLGLWLGSALMAGISAGVTFNTVRAHRVSINAEPYNHPMLASEGSDIVAGAVAHRIFVIMEMLGGLCGMLALVLVALQAVSLRQHLHKRGGSISYNLRWLAIVGALGLYALLGVHMSPKIWELRNIEYDIAQPAEARELAAAEIENIYHPWSERALLGAITLIATSLVLTPFVSTSVAPPTPQQTASSATFKSI